jgi:hypothetical protein
MRKVPPRGKVAYCRYSTLGYDVGVAFNEKGSWNRKRFAPKHLLKIPTVILAARQACAYLLSGELIER